MSLISSLFTGVSGLLGNSKAMNIIGDNIANVNTVGFKGSKAVFGDLFSTVLNNGPTTSQLGRGSMLQGIIQSFDQGAFETSSNALDLAIDGNGFFVVNDGIGNFYTRAGQFRMNDDGVVQTLSGEILQGFQVTNNVVATTLSDVSLTGVQSQPQSTTEFTLGAQLDGSEATGFVFNSPIQVFNSVGAQDILSVQFTKIAAAGNDWGVNFTSSIGTVTGAAVPPAFDVTLNFDTTGQLTGINGGALADVTVDLDYSASSPPGAASQLINWNLADLAGVSNGDMTAFATSSSNNSVIQDGFASGILIGVAVDFDGTVAGLFNNGQSQPLYQLGLADFLAPTGLTRLGKNLFAESRLSGQPVISLPETGALGSVLGNTLELSNVDLAEEFVQLIKTQQAFQASARVISTTDDLLTETVNLTR